MATRLKTVEFAMPVLAAYTDAAALTNLTQITVYLPETGTKTFRSVVATLSMMQTATAAGNVTSRLLQCRLGAAAYTSNSNANLYTGSGEDIFLFHAVDLTSHFTTNWTGTSMTFDAQITVDGTATAVAWTNVNVTLSVTYEYDDTSTTQIKTVRIPLNAPVGAFATTKPGTATATIPALNTELPEASKVYRNQHIVVQGNVAQAAATADITLTMQLDATASITSGIFEGGQASDYFFRYVWDCSTPLDETISMGFYLWGSAAKFNHVQAWLVVTYEFDSTSANDVFVSLLIPSSGGMGGLSTSSDYLRVFADFRVPESGLVQKQSAYYAFWTDTGAVAGLNMRFGTGSFVAYTDTAVALCGSNGAMIRNDSGYTLAQGLNTVSVDVYCTETAQDFVGAFDGFFVINYTCDKPTGGHGAVNHSVRWWMEAPFNGASVTIESIAAWAPVIPESDYFLTSVGVDLQFYANSTNGGFAPQIDVERLAAEGGVTWDPVAAYSAVSDFETGLYTTVVDCEDFFKQWPGDLRAGKSVRRDLETSRRWRATNLQLVAMWDSFSLWFTYHAQTWTVSGTVSSSSGGTVTITLHDATTHEALKSTTRTGNGSYSFTWYDTVRSVYVTARETDALTMRTGNGVAS
jgi:hypothetical protein